MSSHMTKVIERNAVEAAIVRRIQAKDESAFREFVDRYRRTVLSTVSRILGKHNDREDIAQQVFANIYFSIGSFDQRCSLLTWVHKITVNECYNYLRKKRVRKLLYESDFSSEESFGMATNSAAVDLRQRVDVSLINRDLIEKHLASLAANDRRLLPLRERVGHSVAELSKIVRMGENTIKVKLFRARRKLAKTAQRLAVAQPRRSLAAVPVTIPRLEGTDEVNYKP
jgi:RNA polymerase sigma-70 factor (ECF subfamily)